MLSIDVYFSINKHQDSLYASIEQLKDEKNNLPENQWIKTINVANYQAIIPLPYTHIGSENVWIAPQSDMMKNVLTISLKTGLPTMAVTMSRTSLSQTYKNIPLVLEPYKPLEIVNKFSSRKSFLVLAKEDEINTSERNLLKKCTKIDSSVLYNIYELSFSSLEKWTDSLYVNTKSEFNKTKTYAVGNYFSTDSTVNFIHQTFDENSTPIKLVGIGAYTDLIHQYNTLFIGGIPNIKNEEYTFSFWMYDFKKDLFPRTNIEIDLLDEKDVCYQVLYTNPQTSLKIMDGDWALIEYKFTVAHPSDKIKITLWNPDLWKDNKLIVDELWIKPVSTNIYCEKETNILFKNNRYYSPD